MHTVQGVQIRMLVESYANKQARIDGKKPILTENIIENADFALTTFYMLLKKKFGDFADSTDDFADDWKQEEKPKQIIYTQQSSQGDLISRYEENIPEETENTVEESAENETVNIDIIPLDVAAEESIQSEADNGNN